MLKTPKQRDWKAISTVALHWLRDLAVCLLGVRPPSGITNGSSLRLSERLLHILTFVLAIGLFLTASLLYCAVALNISRDVQLPLAFLSPFLNLNNQVYLFLVLVACLLLTVRCVTRRVQVENAILDNVAAISAATKLGVVTGGTRQAGVKRESPEYHARNTFWDAFPFASIVFFLVSAFIILDVVPSAASESPEKQLLRLGLSLAAALVTSIVVLYGAHLVRFESKVTDLAGKTREAASEAGQAAAELKIGNDRSKDFLDSAEQIDFDLHRLMGITGVAIQSLESTTTYQKATAELPRTSNADQYVEARSALTMMSNDSVCRHPNHSELEPEYLPAARNMIASFLGEMAWDLGERCLITNALNYTSFLVGAARGFEEVRKYRHNNDKKLRVFYLTHTLMAPPHLLNWPSDMTQNGHSACHIRPFMLEYMTYCRYFAANRSRYIHGRAFRTVPSDRQKHIVDDPREFTIEGFTNPKRHNFPAHCWPTGVPFMAPISFDGTDLRLYPKQRSQRSVLGIDSPLSAEGLEELFCFIKRQDDWEVNPTYATGQASNAGLFWPLFREQYDIGNIGNPDPKALREKLVGELLLKENILRMLTTCYRGQSVNEKARAEILEGRIKTFINLMKGIRYTSQYTKGDPDALPALDRLFKAYEECLMPSRWGFHWRSDDMAPISALDLWEDVKTALMLVANSILGEFNHDHDREPWSGFMEWFGKEFHSAPELCMPYCPFGDTRQVDVIVGELLNQAKQEQIPPETMNLWKREWDELVGREFALIGIMKVNMDDGCPSKESIRQGLLNWASNNRQTQNECHVLHVMGLSASIDWPWKHAEIAWLLPCKHGIVKLRAMVRYYAEVMKMSRS